MFLKLYWHHDGISILNDNKFPDLFDAIEWIVAHYDLNYFYLSIVE